MTIGSLRYAQARLSQIAVLKSKYVDCGFVDFECCVEPISNSSGKHGSRFYEYRVSARSEGLDYDLRAKASAFARK